MDQFVNMKSPDRSAMDWRCITIGGVMRDTVVRPGCLRPGTAEFDTYRGETKDKGSMMGGHPFTFGGGAAHHGYGSMWCATASSTRVALVRIGKNDTIATISVVIAPVPVVGAERDEEIASIRQRLVKDETNDCDPSKVSNAKPGKVALIVDDDGRLWVPHAIRFWERGVIFDVHDRTGKHLGRVRIPQAQSLQLLPVRARGTEVWFAARDDDDVLSIVRYTIIR